MAGWSLELLDAALGISTPNFFSFLPDSARSKVDNIQLGWSKTAGPWLYYFTWWLLGTPGGPLSGVFDDISLFNEGTDPQDLNLNGDHTLNGLNVVGNSWTLSGGTLILSNIYPNLGWGFLRYSGLQTLTFKTPLSIPKGLLVHVPDRDGTVRFLGEVSLLQTLRKTGYSTLLIEAPLRAYSLSKGLSEGLSEGLFNWLFDGFHDPLNPWTEKRGPSGIS